MKYIPKRSNLVEEHMETKLNGNGCGQAADELTGHQRHGKRHGRTDVRKCGRVHERQHGPDDKRESGCGHAAGHGQKNAPGDGNAHGHQGGHACNGGPGRDLPDQWARPRTAGMSPAHRGGMRPAGRGKAKPRVVRRGALPYGRIAFRPVRPCVRAPCIYAENPWACRSSWLGAALPHPDLGPG